MDNPSDETKLLPLAKVDARAIKAERHLASIHAKTALLHAALDAPEVPEVIHLESRRKGLRAKSAGEVEAVVNTARDLSGNDGAPEGAEIRNLSERLRPKRTGAQPLTAEAKLIERVNNSLVADRHELVVHYNVGEPEQMALVRGDASLKLSEHPLLCNPEKTPKSILIADTSLVDGRIRTKYHSVSIAKMDSTFGNVIAENRGWVETLKKELGFVESLSNTSTAEKVSFGLTSAFALISFANAYQQLSNAKATGPDGEEHYIPSQLMWGALSTMFGAALGYMALAPHVPALRGR